MSTTLSGTCGWVNNWPEASILLNSCFYLLLLQNFLILNTMQELWHQIKEFQTTGSLWILKFIQNVADIYYTHWVINSGCKPHLLQSMTWHHLTIYKKRAVFSGKDILVIFNRRIENKMLNLWSFSSAFYQKHS